MFENTSTANTPLSHTYLLSNMSILPSCPICGKNRTFSYIMIRVNISHWKYFASFKRCISPKYSSNFDPCAYHILYSCTVYPLRQSWARHNCVTSRLAAMLYRMNQRIYISDRRYNTPLRLPNIRLSQPLPALSAIYCTAFPSDRAGLERLKESNVWKTRGEGIYSLV